MRFKALICVLIMTLLLAGCGSTDISDKTTITTSNVTTTSTTKATTKKTTTTTKTTTKRTTSVTFREEVGQMVWISSTGSKYHSHSSCSNMKSPRHVSLSNARSQGYTACKKCY